MSRLVERHYTIEDYFAIEESSTTKHEYFGGEIFAMAGASVRHNRIAGNVYAALRASLRGSDCEAFGSDLRADAGRTLHLPGRAGGLRRNTVERRAFGDGDESGADRRGAVRFDKGLRPGAEVRAIQDYRELTRISANRAGRVARRASLQGERRRAERMAAATLRRARSANRVVCSGHHALTR